jgi:Uma2 family endonuclease
MNAPFAPIRLASRLTADDVLTLLEARILDPEADFELLDGEIITVSPAGPLHQWIHRMLERKLRPLEDEHWLTSGATLRLSDNSLVDPDIAIYPLTFDPLAFPPTEVVLAVEVSVSTRAYDLGRKADAYARAGVQELWVVDGDARITHVHREPSPAGWGAIREVPFDAPLSPAVRPDLILTID